ncbi:hypothetical protein ACEWY4_020878 [Coilia grayii]|uniref:MARVEL domain-containing protein n=1 Tax=Coilia grayii TaxID=363190 RepID=A0ABD1J7D4_9TELE
MAPQTEAVAGNDIAGRLKSLAGLLRFLQLLLGAGIWIALAANRYEGAAHFALLVAVLFWLLTLAALVVGALDKQALVPLAGGEHWPLSNLLLDVAATLLYLAAVAILAHKMEKNAYCMVKQYKYTCLYKAYLTALVFASLTTAAYLVSAAYRIVQRCRGHTPPV